MAKRDMLYADYIALAFDAVIIEDEASGMFFLDPHYRVTLRDWELDPAQIIDYPMTWSDIGEMLQLEVKRRNDCASHGKKVMDWLYQIITAVVEPEVMQAENEYIKNMMEYMRLNASLKDKEKDLDKREAQMESKDNVRQLMPGMSFSKKKTN